MSEKLFALRKIGGSMSETVLWTNPNQTGNFGATTITLSESVNNFKYIKVVFRFSTQTNNQNYVIFPLDMWINSTATNGKNRCVIASYASNIFARGIAYASATSVTIGACYQVNQTGSGNNYVIPVEVIGLK